MNYYKIILILVIFFKTGNVFSDTNIFNVNNVEIEKKVTSSNEELAIKAIKKGFEELSYKILLEEDIVKLSQLKFSEIKELVKYYQISNNQENNISPEKINFNIAFDKEKIHDLFYKRRISYSEISDKEMYILPILKIDGRVFIFNKNYFYSKWNEVFETDLIEFILPLENIETLQNINLNKDNLLSINIKDIFKEYQNKNLTVVVIEDSNSKEEKIYFKTLISGKKIVRNISVKKLNLNKDDFYKKIIIETKKDIINLIKSQNLIDIRVPSFINAQLIIDKKNNIVNLNNRLKNIDIIENIYIQEYNNKSIFLKIKYLGKLNKIIKELEKQSIILKLSGDQWKIKII